MKKFIFTFTVILALMTVKLSASQLNIRMFNNAGFIVVLDNYLNSGVTNNYTFYQLNPGNHNMKVYRPAPNGRNYSKLIFSGMIHVPAGMNIISLIDNYNQYRVLSQFPLHKEKGKNGYFEYEGYYEKEKHNHAGGKGYKRPPTYNHEYGMSEYDFGYLITSLKSTSFDGTRVRIAQTALRNNNISSKQVAELLGYFTFESNNVEVAKTAWHSVTDPERFYIIYPLFTFNSSINEIENYIQSR